MHTVPLLIATLLGVVFWRQLLSVVAAGTILLLALGLVFVVQMVAGTASVYPGG